MKTTCKIIKQTEQDTSFNFVTEQYGSKKSVEWYLELKYESSKDMAVNSLLYEYNIPVAQCPDYEEENGIITYTDSMDKNEYDSEDYKAFKKALGKI